MKVLIVEPFYTGSHKQWVEGIKKFSSHEIHVLKLSGHHWKWRMHGGALTLARQFLESSQNYDLILCTDMLDLTTFQALTRSRTSSTPFILYFHENQIMYPWSSQDKDTQLQRDHHYGFINLSSALAADACWFNSDFHRSGFLEEAERFLRNFPDLNEIQSIQSIRSKVMSVGLDLKSLEQNEMIVKEPAPLILWNHRWEQDKNPDSFFKTLYKVKERNIPFKLAVIGEKFKSTPPIFNEAKEKLSSHIIHWGFVDSYEEYRNWLWKADILPVTSNQEFFGVSVVEAMYCHTYPILPNRLSFPEHIPEEWKSRCLYNSEHELLEKLISALENRPVHDFADSLKRYDWKNTILKYDEEINHLKKATH